MKKNNNDANDEVVYNSEEQAIIDRAKAIAIKYLKDTYELDIELTEERLLPTYVASQVILKGNAIGNIEQNFSIYINYKTDEISEFGMSPELVAEIRARGYEPFDKK